jgi:fumarylacetoacetase
LDALEAFRTEGAKHEVVAPYLSSPETGSYSVDLMVEIISRGKSTVTCRSNFGKSLYWNFRQMLAHQKLGGCSLEAGEILASGFRRKRRCERMPLEVHMEW